MGLKDTVGRQLAPRIQDLAPGLTTGFVREALHRAKGNVKVAALLLQGCDEGQAAELLRRTEGRLREALVLADTELNRR